MKVVGISTTEPTNLEPKTSNDYFCKKPLYSLTSVLYFRMKVFKDSQFKFLSKTPNTPKYYIQTLSTVIKEYDPELNLTY